MHPEIIKKMLPTSVNAIMVSLHDFMEFGLEFSKSLPQAHLLKSVKFWTLSMSKLIAFLLTVLAVGQRSQ